MAINLNYHNFQRKVNIFCRISSYKVLSHVKPSKLYYGGTNDKRIKYVRNLNMKNLNINDLTNWNCRKDICLLPIRHCINSNYIRYVWIDLFFFSSNGATWLACEVLWEKCSEIHITLLGNFLAISSMRENMPLINWF